MNELELVAEVAEELAEPMRALRDRLALVVDQLERHVTTSTGPNPYPWRSLQTLRQDIGSAYLGATEVSHRLDGLVQALAIEDAPSWFDATAAVELALRLVHAQVSGGELELLVDLGATPPARGMAGAFALVVAQLVATSARSARALPNSAVTVRITREPHDVVVTVADNGMGSDRAAHLGELARQLLLPWGGSCEAASAAGQGCTFELRLIGNPDS